MWGGGRARARVARYSCAAVHMVSPPLPVELLFDRDAHENELRVQYGRVYDRHGWGKKKHVHLDAELASSEAHLLACSLWRLSGGVAKENLCMIPCVFRPTKCVLVSCLGANCLHSDVTKAGVTRRQSLVFSLHSSPCSACLQQLTRMRASVPLPSWLCELETVCWKYSNPQPREPRSTMYQLNHVPHQVLLCM